MTLRVFHSAFYPENEGVKGSSVAAASQRSIVDVVKALDEAATQRVVAARDRAKELIQEAEQRLAEAYEGYDQQFADLTQELTDTRDDYNNKIAQTRARFDDLLDLVDPAPGTPGRKILDLEINTDGLTGRISNIETNVGSPDGKGTLFGRIAAIELITEGDGFVTAEQFNELRTEASARARVFIQDTPPTGAPDGILLSNGDLWINPSDNNKLSRYSPNGWVDATPVWSNLKTFAQPEAPSEGMNTGDLWFDTNDGNRLYRYDGQNWVLSDDDRVGSLVNSLVTANTAISNLQTGKASVERVDDVETIAQLKNRTFVQDNPPQSPVNGVSLVYGDLWIDTNDSNKLYSWKGLSTGWVLSTDERALDEVIAARGGSPTLVARINSLQTTLTDALSGKVSVSDYNALSAEVRAAAGDGLSLSDRLQDLQVKVDGAATAADLSQVTTKINQKARTFVSTTQPSNPSDGLALVAGDLWINPNQNNRLSRYSGTDWVNVTPVSSTLKTYAQPDEPTGSLNSGDLWFDTDDGNKMYRYNGTLWALADDTRIGSLEGTVSSLTTAVSDLSTGKAEASVVEDIRTVTNLKTRTFVQASQPVSPVNGVSLIIGDTWIDTDDNNKMYTWRGSTPGWVLSSDTRALDEILAARGGELNLSARFSSVIDSFNDALDGKAGASEYELLEAEVRTAAGGAGKVLNERFAEVEISVAGKASQTEITSLTTKLDQKSRTFVQSTKPTGTPNGMALVAGDLWVDSSNNNKLWRYTGVGTTWTDITPVSSSLKTFASGTQPTTGMSTGDLWFDTSDSNKMYRYNGTIWAPTTDARIGQILTDISNINNSVSDLQTGKADASTVTTINNQITLKNRIFAQNEPPVSPMNGIALVVGDAWIDTNDSNKLYTWRGASGWVLSSDSRAITELENARSGFASLTAKLTNMTTTTNDALNGKATITQLNDVIGRVATTENSISGISTTLTDIQTELGNKATVTQMNNVQASANARARIILSTTQPANPHGGIALSTGDIWVNTSTGTNKGKQMAWSGSAWTDITDARLIAATDATAALTAKLTGITTTVVDELNKKAEASAVSTLQATANAKSRTFRQNTAPTNPNGGLPLTNGDQWYNTSNNYELKIWGGSSWLDATDPRIATALSDVGTINAKIGTISGTIADALNNKAEASRVTTLETELQGDPNAPAGSAARKGIKARMTTTETVSTDAYNRAFATYGVEQDVNGYLTGFKLTNNGSSGSFRIRADKFEIKAPNSTGQRTEYSGNSWKVYGPNGVLRVEMGVFA